MIVCVIQLVIWLLFQVGNEGLASDLPDDPDTEEALKEFDFLVNAEDGEGAGEARSSGDGTEWGKIMQKVNINFIIIKYYENRVHLLSFLKDLSVTIE